MFRQIISGSILSTLECLRFTPQPHRHDYEGAPLILRLFPLIMALELPLTYDSSLNNSCKGQDRSLAAENDAVGERHLQES